MPETGTKNAVLGKIDDKKEIDGNKVLKDASGKEDFLTADEIKGKISAEIASNPDLQAIKLQIDALQGQIGQVTETSDGGIDVNNNDQNQQLINKKKELTDKILAGLGEDFFHVTYNGESKIAYYKDIEGEVDAYHREIIESNDPALFSASIDKAISEVVGLDEGDLKLDAELKVQAETKKELQGLKDLVEKKEEGFFAELKQGLTDFTESVKSFFTEGSFEDLPDTAKSFIKGAVAIFGPLLMGIAPFFGKAGASIVKNISGIMKSLGISRENRGSLPVHEPDNYAEEVSKITEIKIEDITRGLYHPDLLKTKKEGELEKQLGVTKLINKDSMKLAVENIDDSKKDATFVELVKEGISNGTFTNVDSKTALSTLYSTITATPDSKSLSVLIGGPPIELPDDWVGKTVTWQEKEYPVFDNWSIGIHVMMKQINDRKLKPNVPIEKKTRVSELLSHLPIQTTTTESNNLANSSPSDEIVE